MNNNTTMMFPPFFGLTPAEQEKVVRLDIPIYERLTAAGLVGKLWQATGTGEQRTLDCIGPSGIVGTVRASDFLSASDRDAVAMIDLANE